MLKKKFIDDMLYVIRTNKPKTIGELCHYHAYGIWFIDEMRCRYGRNTLDWSYINANESKFLLNMNGIFYRYDETIEGLRKDLEKYYPGGNMEANFNDKVIEKFIMDNIAGFVKVPIFRGSISMFRSNRYCFVNGDINITIFPNIEELEGGVITSNYESDLVIVVNEKFCFNIHSREIVAELKKQLVEEIEIKHIRDVFDAQQKQQALSINAKHDFIKAHNLYSKEL